MCCGMMNLNHLEYWLTIIVTLRILDAFGFLWGVCCSVCFVDTYQEHFWIYRSLYKFTTSQISHMIHGLSHLMASEHSVHLVHALGTLPALSTLHRTKETTIWHKHKKLHGTLECIHTTYSTTKSSHKGPKMCSILKSYDDCQPVLKMIQIHHSTTWQKSPQYTLCITTPHTKNQKCHVSSELWWLSAKT